MPNKEEFEGQLGIASFDPNEDVSTTYSFKFYTYTKEDLKDKLDGGIFMMLNIKFLKRKSRRLYVCKR